MRRLFVVFMCLPFFVMAIAQTQQGVAYRYNGKKPRTPLGNVTISYDANRRTVVSNEQDGSFCLTLTSQKMGDRIGQVTVKKREMMVFNQHAVDEWSVRKEPLLLILCNADEFEKQKENLINIGKREAKKKYERQKAELEEQLNASKIKLADYEVALDKAYEELDRLQKNIAEYADALTRIDQSELDEQMQEVLDLYERGQVEESIKKLNDMKLAERFVQTIERKQYHEKGLETAIQDSSLMISQIRASISIYKNSNEWEKAMEYLKLLADKLNTYEDVLIYATFSIRQNNFHDAEEYCKKALQLLNRDGDISEDQKLGIKSLIYCQLGAVHSSMDRLGESEKCFQLSYDCLNSLRQKGEIHLDEMARIQANLGSIYTRTNRMKEGERMFGKAIDNYRHCDIINDSASVSVIAQLGNTLKSLAVLYQMTGKSDKCEALYSEAVDMLRRSAKVHPKEYETDLANALRTMALFLLDAKRYEESEELLVEAIDIAEHLASENSHAYAMDYAVTLNYLGVLYFETDRLKLSEKMFNAALEIFRCRVNSVPLVYKVYMARVVGYLGSTQMVQGNYEEAIIYYGEALEVFREIEHSEQLGFDGTYMINESFPQIVRNLALALLIQGKMETLESICSQYRDELGVDFHRYLQKWTDAGLIPPERESDVESIKQMLNE